MRRIGALLFCLLMYGWNTSLPAPAVTTVNEDAYNITVQFNSERKLISENGLPDKPPKQKRLNAPTQDLTFVYEEKPNPPYYLGEKHINWKKPGVTLEVLKLLETQLNITIRFKRFSWKRALKMVEENRADGIFHASFKSERMKIGVYPMQSGSVDPSRRIMRNSYVLYKLKDSPLEWDGNQFSNLTGNIGATLGYAIVGDLISMGVNVEEERAQSLNLKKLVANRIAGVAALETMTDIHIKDHPNKFADVIKVSPPLKTKDYYLMLSHQFVRENPALSEAIWNAIRDIRTSGIFANIERKYTRH